MASKRHRRSLDELESEALFSVAAKLHDMSSVKSLSTADVLRTPDHFISVLECWGINNYKCSVSKTCRFFRFVG